MASQLASQAQSGFAKSALYDKHRPSYPDNAVSNLLKSLGVEGIPNARILDLAAGTGKFTELISRRKEEYEIIAVEPHEGMRNELAKKSLPNVSVSDGISTSIPVESESIDAVIAAQAFHWFSNEESLREIHRVLNPRGSFGMIWNIEDYNQTRSANATTLWEAKLNELIWSFDDERPRYRHEKWRQIFDDAQVKANPISVTVLANPLFSLPLGEEEEKWTVWLTREEIWARFSTLSQVATLEGEELKRAERIFNEALSSDDVEKNEKEQIALHGVTVAAWTTKIP